MSDYEIGNIVEGRVIKILNYGCILESGDRKGLLHISKVGEEYSRNLRKHIREGEVIKVRIEDIKDDGKLSFSLVELAKQRPRPSKKERKPYVFQYDSSWNNINVRRETVDPEAPFEEKLRKFLKDSDEKRLDIKRSLEAKRS